MKSYARLELALRVQELAAKPHDRTLIPCLTKEKTDSYSDQDTWGENRAPSKGFVSSTEQDLEVRRLEAEMRPEIVRLAHLRL